MSFANPWLLVGLAALTVPVLVHLIRRVERRGEAFPSLMFIERVPFPDRRPRTLRDRALLALRCLAVVLLALAFAGPQCSPEKSSAAASGSVGATVLLLDRSYSMAAAARWQAALDEARRRIDARRGDERMAIVAFDDTARLVAPLTSDGAELRARLDELTAGAGGTRLAGAIDLAGRVLRDSGASQRRIVLVSDLQASAIAEVDRLYLDAEVAFDIAAVTLPVTANAAVLAAELRRPDSGAAAAEEVVRVRVRNTGTEAMGGLDVALQIAGRTTDRRRIDLAAGEERTLRIPVVLPLDRASPARVILGDDALPADNEHHLVLIPDPPVEVALALTETSPPGASSPALFLRQALGVISTPPVRISNLSTTVGDLSSLTDVDVLIADDTTLASNGVRRRVERFVANGGGLLTLLTDTAPAERGPSVLTPGLGTLQRHPTPGLGVALPSVAIEQPVWQSVRDDIADALAATQVLMSRPVESPTGDGETRVLARLTDDAPWLIERRHGSGRSVLMASGVTAAWGNLAVQPGFVPLLQELLRHLAGHEPACVARTVGDVIDLERLAAASPGASDWRRYLSAGGDVVVERPGGSVQRLTNGEALYRSRDAGPHTAHRADGKPPALPFAVNVDRRESLLARASPDELTQRLQRRAETARTESQRLAETAADDTTPLGWNLLAGTLLLLWLEARIANRLSWRRVAAGGPG